MALEMRTSCDACGEDLPPESGAAFICSYEKTYCAEDAINNHFNCGGCGMELVRRPRRMVDAEKPATE